MRLAFPLAAIVLSIGLLLPVASQPLEAAGPGCAELPLETGSAPPAANTSTALNVVTLNTARVEDATHILKDVRGVPAVANADVWLLQEVVKPARAPESVAARLAAALGASYVFAPADVMDDGKLQSGVATLSRYPLQDARVRRLSHHDLKFNTRCRIGLEVTVMAPTGPVHVVNVHLDTRITSDQRVRQVTPLLDAILDWKGPIVIGGDFNTANVRWMWNVLPIPFGQNQRDALHDAFRARGFDASPDGSRGTLNVLFIELRLDWIFSRGFKPIASGVANVNFSDHEAAWVKLAQAGSY